MTAFSEIPDCLHQCKHCNAVWWKPKNEHVEYVQEERKTYHSHAWADKVFPIFFAIIMISAGILAGYIILKLSSRPSSLQSPKTVVREETRQVATIAATLTAGASASLTPTPKPPSKWGSATQEYLCQVFGKDCKTALVIAKEHDLNCQWGKGTSHVGLFAIDIASEGMTEEEAKDCYSNIDKAKEIFDREGFAPWGK